MANVEILKNENMVREQFMRIAMARLASQYKFKPQRVAIAAVMYRNWLAKKSSQNK